MAEEFELYFKSEIEIELTWKVLKLNLKFFKAFKKIFWVPSAT